MPTDDLKKEVEENTKAIATLIEQHDEAMCLIHQLTLKYRELKNKVEGTRVIRTRI